MWEMEIDKSKIANLNFSVIDYDFRKENKNVDDLVQLHKEAYYEDKVYMNSNWKSIINYFYKINTEKITYFVYDEKKLIASCIGYYNPYSKKKFLFSICTHPDYSRKGISKRMLSEFLKSTPQSNYYLDVFKSAEKAVSLYEKLGFEKNKVSEIVLSLKL